jgi:peptide/nickel transport system permease protein
MDMPVHLLKQPRFTIPVALLILILIVAAFAPLVSPYNPVKIDPTNRLMGPSSEHLLGTDNLGRDILSRLIFGARSSITVAFGSAILAGVVGTAIGICGGYFSNWTELLTLRVVDVILSFPPIVLAILVVTLAGPGILTLIFVIAFLYVPSFARIAYGQTLTLKQMEYVEAVKALGGGHIRIMLRTLLPNMLGPLLVQFSLTVAIALLLEAGLSFLGLGVVPPTPSWGLMIRDARNYLLIEPGALFWPSAAITVTILAVNALSDVIGEAADPRLRQHRRLTKGKGPTTRMRQIDSEQAADAANKDNTEAARE